jgi:hypothetical protein
MHGQSVAVLVDGEQAAGHHSAPDCWEHYISRAGAYKRDSQEAEFETWGLRFEISSFAFSGSFWISEAKFLTIREVCHEMRIHPLVFSSSPLKFSSSPGPSPHAAREKDDGSVCGWSR